MRDTILVSIITFFIIFFKSFAKIYRKNFCGGENGEHRLAAAITFPRPAGFFLREFYKKGTGQGRGECKRGEKVGKGEKRKGFFTESAGEKGKKDFLPGIYQNRAVGETPVGAGKRAGEKAFGRIDRRTGKGKGGQSAETGRGRKRGGVGCGRRRSGCMIFAFTAPFLHDFCIMRRARKRAEREKNRLTRLKYVLPNR